MKPWLISGRIYEEASICDDQIPHWICNSLSFFLGEGYATSYGHRTHLNTILIEVESDSGRKGYGEIAQTTGGTVNPLQPAFLKETRELAESLVGQRIIDTEAMRAHLHALGAHSNQLMGFETAAMDAYCRERAIPLSDLLGGRRQEAIPQYFTIGHPDPDIIAQEIKKGRRNRHSRFSGKIGL